MEIEIEVEVEIEIEIAVRVRVRVVIGRVSVEIVAAVESVVVSVVASRRRRRSAMPDLTACRGITCEITCAGGASKVGVGVRWQRVGVVTIHRNKFKKQFCGGESIF